MGTATTATVIVLLCKLINVVVVAQRCLAPSKANYQRAVNGLLSDRSTVSYYLNRG